MSQSKMFIVKGVSAIKPINCDLRTLIYNDLTGSCPNATAVTEASSERTITYKEILGKSCTLAQYLQKNNFGNGKIVALCCENSIEFIICAIGVIFSGAVLTPINPNYTNLELVHMLNVYQPDIILCESKHQNQFSIQKESKCMAKIIPIDTKSGVLELIKDMPLTFKLEKLEKNVDLDDTVLLLATSGTTGLPKGIMITHRNFIIRNIHFKDPTFFNQNTSRVAGVLCPFFHVYGFTRILFNICRHIHTIIFPNFEEKLFLSSIEKYRISMIPILPAILVFLNQSPLVDQYDLSSLDEITCAGTPLPNDLEKDVKKRLKVKYIAQLYGLTELLNLTCNPIGYEKAGSVGKVLYGLDCKVLDINTRKPLQAYEIGELCFGGVRIFKGYYRDPERTKKCFGTNGFFDTGDIGYFDDEGYIYIVDKVTELINYKGFQIFPVELEAILMTNTKIKDVGVVGLPDKDAGELPISFVVPHPHASITKQEVQEFVAEKVSSNKQLRGGVIFCASLPKSVMGKTLRRDLRKQLQNMKNDL